MRLVKSLLVGTAVVLLPATGFAQSALTGEVTDNTGASCRASPWKQPVRR